MKNIIKSLVIVVAVAAVAGGATWAVFSDTAVVSGVTFSTGDANLKITQVYMHNWMENGTADDLDVHFPENIYPGYEGSWGSPDGVIYLGNFSESDINLVVSAKIENYTETINKIDDTIELAMAWGGNCDPGGVGTGFHTLKWWKNNSEVLFTGSDSECGYLPNDHSDGYGGYAKAVKFYLKVPETAGNEISEGEASFNIRFDAEQEL